MYALLPRPPGFHCPARACLSIEPGSRHSRQTHVHVARPPSLLAHLAASMATLPPPTTITLLPRGGFFAGVDLLEIVQGIDVRLAASSPATPSVRLFQVPPATKTASKRPLRSARATLLPTSTPSSKAIPMSSRAWTCSHHVFRQPVRRYAVKSMPPASGSFSYTVTRCPAFLK